jgi:hypothetical protein
MNGRVHLCACLYAMVHFCVWGGVWVCRLWAAADVRRCEGGGRPQHTKLVDGDKCEVHYIIQVDPRGRIPAWAAARATAGTVVDILKHVAKVARE